MLLKFKPVESQTEFFADDHRAYVQNIKIIYCFVKETKVLNIRVQEFFLLHDDS